MRPLAEADRLGLVIHVGNLQQPDLQAGGSVQQGKGAHQGLVRVHALVSGPAAEELAPFVQGERPTAEVVRLLRGQGPGRIDQHDVLGASEAEELPQHDQPALAGLGQGGQEGFDVVHVHQGPVVLPTVGHEEEREVTHGGQGGLQGVIAARPGAGPAGPVLGSHPRGVEGNDRLLQRLGNRIETALSPTGGEPFGLVGGQGQAAEGEEVLERAGEGAHRPSGPAGTLQQGPG